MTDSRDKRTRRDFLRLMGRLGLGMSLAPVVWQAFSTCGVLDGNGRVLGATMRQGNRTADHYTRLRGKQVRCTLCPRRETLRPGERGYCLGRENRDGRLVTHAYGQPCVLNIDPVGKNPLAQFYPEMEVLAVAHAGCNLRCKYCQNFQYIEHGPTETKNITPFDPAATVAKMKEKRIGGVGFTYTEPAYAPEFVAEFAQCCGEAGLKRTICTAGFVEEKPFRELLRHFEAVTITYKGPTERFYREVVDGALAPVLKAMEAAKSEGVWLEVATLIVPTLNDGADDLRTMARWIHDHLGPQTPWHLERFDPQYRLRNLPPTPQTTLETAYAIGRDAGLDYVYLSNLAPHVHNHTACPSCDRTVIKRMGFKVLENLVRGGKCPHCGTELAGVWE